MAMSEELFRSRMKFISLNIQKAKSILKNKNLNDDYSEKIQKQILILQEERITVKTNFLEAKQLGFINQLDSLNKELKSDMLKQAISNSAPPIYKLNQIGLNSPLIRKKTKRSKGPNLYE